MQSPTYFQSSDESYYPYCEYGGPEVLKVEQVEKPTPNDNQVLVKVRANSVNPLDLTIRGPLWLRPLIWSAQTKGHSTGVTISPEPVEAVGKNVTNFKPGDEVFGTSGALAEYDVLADRAVVLKPANMTFEQAASVPVAAITALQGLREKGKFRLGKRS